MTTTIASLFKLMTTDTDMIFIPPSAFNIMTTITNNKQQPTHDVDNS